MKLPSDDATVRKMFPRSYEKMMKSCGRQPTPPGRALVVAPDGSRWHVAEQQLDEALRQGYRRG